MRNNTERPITVEFGTNQLVGLQRENIIACLHRIMRGERRDGSTPALWDGHAAERVMNILRNSFV